MSRSAKEVCPVQREGAGDTLTRLPQSLPPTVHLSASLQDHLHALNTSTVELVALLGNMRLGSQDARADAFLSKARFEPPENQPHQCSLLLCRGRKGAALVCIALGVHLQLQLRSCPSAAKALQSAAC